MPYVTTDKTSGQTVLCRLEYARDLHAAGSVYHKTCDVNFRTKKQVPRRFHLACVSSSAKKPCFGGRPKDAEKSDAFERTIEYFKENDDEQITM